MQIQFLGLSSFKITTKEATIFIDPCGKESGLTQPRGNADLVLLSEPNNPTYSGYSSLSDNPFLIDSPGEFDKKGVTVAGLPIKHNDKYITVWLIESEGIKILDLSHISNFSLNEDELNSLGQIDILIIPVGSGVVLDSSQAAKITNQIGPAVAIPSHYNSAGVKIKLDPADQYLKDLGGKSENLEKLTVKAKDFVGSETTRIIVLDPSK